MKVKKIKKEWTMEDTNAYILALLEKNKLKDMKVKRGKFIRTFKSGSKAEILQLPEKPFAWDLGADLSTFKVGQKVSVIWEYSNGYSSISNESKTIYIPTNYLKLI
jgi:hypothetical protein